MTSFCRQGEGLKKALKNCGDTHVWSLRESQGLRSMELLCRIKQNFINFVWYAGYQGSFQPALNLAKITYISCIEMNSE